MLGEGHRVFGLTSPGESVREESAKKPLTISFEPPDISNSSTISWGLLLFGTGFARQVASRLHHGIPIAIVGDSEFLVNCCLGKAHCREPSLKKLLQVAQEGLRQLVSKFRAKSFPGKDLVVHTPRRDNAAADAMANRALDNGSFQHCRSSEVESFCGQLIDDSSDTLGVVFSFDGASRGNPGEASHGNSAWWGRWSAEGFNQQGVLFEAGYQIGTKTNNVAEARGLAFAVKASVHFNFWLVEVCSRLAVRHAQ